MNFRMISTIGFVLLIGMLYGAVFRDSTNANPRENKYNSGNGYVLFDPEMAPKEIRAEVLKGFNILRETKLHLPEYAGDKISCTNCHFAAGNSFGGRSNGFSLVGVNQIYPKTLESGKKYTLAERINSCFLRSLNGKALPLDSPDMQSMITYLNWISKGIPKGAEHPWMGTKELRSKHIPNPQNGELVYKAQCALCHGKNGEGQERPEDLSYPPLWGKDSFNDSAGMNKINTFAYFVYENMPYNEPKLTVEEALDVAAYVTSQPRPKLIPAQD